MSTQTVAQPERTYGQILKSSVLVGGSSAANIVIGMARTKAMAVLLGPAGVGLAGVYNSVADLTSTIAGLGVNTSGVRQIAAAVGSGDTALIARTAVVLRRTSMFLGLLGAVLLIAFSGQVSSLSFNSPRYTGTICLLSVAIFFRLVSAGQGALIQGMRRISDLAKMSVWGSLFGTLVTIGVVFCFREKGIVPSLVGGAAVSVFVSWLYSRKVHIQAPSLRASEVRHDVSALLKLGWAFMASSLMVMGSGYVIRIIILREVGVEGTGLYQSAWAIGGLYVGFILQAMGADFYPRLTASASDHETCNRLVNEQAFIGLLLGGPGVLATLTFAPLVIWIFYTARFQAAVELLRWLCLGTMLQIISWPMGFVILAKNKQKIFLLSDLAWMLVYMGLSSVCIRLFGLNGAGMAFFGSYIFHILLIYPIVRCLTGFRWTAENKRSGLLFLSGIGIVFYGFYILPFLWAVCVGLLAAALGSAYSTWVLCTLVPLEHIPRPLRQLILGLGRARLSAIRTA